MTIRRLQAPLFSLLLAGGCLAETPTYTRNVAPIIQKNCQGCHRPGESAPFSLLTYEQTRPWAKAIKAAVVTRKMPPWFADPHYGKFKNDSSLQQKDVDTLAAWVDAGSPKGDPKDMPEPVEFAEGWAIPKPDKVIELPTPFAIPASGTIEYQYVLIPAPFQTDQWVQFAEARPGDRAHVHHVIAYIREPGSQWLKDAKPGIPFVPSKASSEDKKENVDGPGDMLASFAPGQPPEGFPEGQAKLVKAGSDIFIQVHYTTNGTASTDRTRIGLVFAKQPPKERVLMMSAINTKFKIPAGDPNYKVDAEFELGTTATLYALHPHMHGRGKDFDYRVQYPNGDTVKILSVPNYKFNWQLWYDLEKPMVLPKGTKILCTAHFDNSPNNPDNADATKDVIWGDQSWEEMMIGFFHIVFDAKMSPKELTPMTRVENVVAAN